MKVPELVEQIENLLQGKPVDINADGDKIILPQDITALTVSIKKTEKGIRVDFTNKKPVVNHAGVGLVLNGVDVCVKGVRADARWVPKKFEPFYSWERLGVSTWLSSE